MGDIKSAWEIAQERANRLGRLSAEEQKQQKEQECRQIAAGIAQNYFDPSETQDIATILDKYSGEEKTLIELALVGLLTEAITFDSQSGESSSRYGGSGAKSAADCGTDDRPVDGIPPSWKEDKKGSGKWGKGSAASVEDFGPGDRGDKHRR